MSALNIAALLLDNGTMCILALFFNSVFRANKTIDKEIIYEKIDMIVPERRHELIRGPEINYGCDY